MSLFLLKKIYDDDLPSENPASLKRKLPLLEFIGNETCPPRDCLFENPEKPGNFQDFGLVAKAQKPVGLQESETAFPKDENEETVEVKIEKCEVFFSFRRKNS